MEQQKASSSTSLSLVLLPGLDGTGQLFRWFLDSLPLMLKPIVVAFPKDGGDDYPALENHVMGFVPRDEPFVLLGESFSGPLALRIAARGQANLIAVILVASFIAKPVAWLPSFIQHLLHPFIFRLPAQAPFLRWLLLGWKAPTTLVNETINSLRSVDPAVLAGRAKAALTVDATEDFRRCPAPILYLGGRQDRLISSQTAGRLKLLRTDLEWIMLDSPHFLLQRAPATAVQAITEFLSRQCRSIGFQPNHAFSESDTDNSPRSAK